jgi:hypothetical protein
MKKGKYYFIISILFINLIGFIFLNNINREFFLKKIIEIFNLDYLKINLDNFVTKERFIKFKFIPLLNIFLIILFLRFKDYLINFYNHLKFDFLFFLKTIYSYKKKEFFPLILIIFTSLIIKFYYSYTFPIEGDEAATFFGFTKIGLLSSISFYPAPNNHVLNSILTNFTYFLPFNSTINLRIPSVIISSISTFFFYYSFNKFFNKNISFFLTILFTFSYPVIFYGFSARGYSLIILSFIIIFYCTIQIIIKPILYKKYLRIFFVFSIIGFYSIPIFLYPFLICILYLFIYFFRFKLIKQIVFLIKLCTLNIFAVLVIYSPIIIVSGLNSLIKNDFVKPINRIDVIKSLYDHFNQTVNFIFAFDIKYLIIFLFFSFIFLFKKITPQIFYFLFFIFCITPLIIIVHSVIPFNRTWIFLIIPILFLFGYVLTIISNFKLNTFKLLHTLFIIVFILQIYNFDRLLKRRNDFSYLMNDLSAYFIKVDAKNIFCYHYYSMPQILYYFEQNKKDIKIDRYNSVKVSLNIDSIANLNKYDFIINEKNKIIDNYKIIKKYNNNIFIYKKVINEN